MFLVVFKRLMCKRHLFLTHWQNMEGEEKSINTQTTRPLNTSPYHLHRRLGFLASGGCEYLITTPL